MSLYETYNLCRQIKFVSGLWVASKKFAWTGFACVSTMWTYSDESMLLYKSLKIMFWTLIFAFGTSLLYKKVIKFNNTDSYRRKAVSLLAIVTSCALQQSPVTISFAEAVLFHFAAELSFASQAGIHKKIIFWLLPSS